MNLIKRVASLLFVGTLALVLVPGGAFAQGTRTETVSAQVNFTTPNNVSIIGTVTGHRQCGDPIKTEVSFTGMINGAPASATASATERWSGDSNAVIEITKINSWSAPIGKPGPVTLNVSQVSPGLITVNGIPVAMNGSLKAPCAANGTSNPNDPSLGYIFTNPGQGSGNVVMLPNTGEGPILFNPLAIVAMLIMPGILLVLVSGLVNKRARKGSASSRNRLG